MGSGLAYDASGYILQARRGAKMDGLVGWV